MNTSPSILLTLKRASFPLVGPRYQTLAFWPLHAMAAAVDGYHAALLAVFNGSRL